MLALSAAPRSPIMGNYLGLWSEPTSEERVIQNHHHDLQEAIIYPLNVASKLLQEGVVSRTLVSEVSTQGRSQLQNSTAIITAVTASIHSKPEQFQVFVSVLEDSPESANLARRMRNELSTLKPAPELTERLMERKGWWYTVSAEYKRDFIHLQGSFGKLYRSLCETVKSQVPVKALKQHLCQTFSEFEIALQDISTVDNVMKAVRKESSLTDFAYFEQIANHFDLQQIKEKVQVYRNTLNLFCQYTLDNHTYVRSFHEDYPRYILSSDKIVFQLQWKAREKTLKDIRDVLRMSFGRLADRVQIVVIEDGSVVVVCWAPRYLMEELVRQASERVHRLAEVGVVKLTVGDTEVNIDKHSSSSHQRKHTVGEIIQSNQASQSFEAHLMMRSIPYQVSSREKQASSSYLYSLGSAQNIVPPNVPDHHSKFDSASGIPGRRSKKMKTATYFTHLSSSRGMVISEDHLIVAVSYGDYRIAILNRASGEKVNRFGRNGLGKMEFRGPEGVALTQDGCIVVADTLNHRLQVLTVEGAFVAAVGSPGSQPLQFKCPYDVAVYNGKLFVTERSNNRVQVLNPDLSYSHCFGSKGDKPGELNGPSGIAIDQDGMVYVSDTGNYRIQKFTPEGSIMAFFEDKEFGSSTSLSPFGLCFDCNGLLYVIDMGRDSTVCVYNTSGQFLGYIGNSDGSSFDGPRFIVTDNDRLYISDNNGVITYKCYQQ